MQNELFLFYTKLHLVFQIHIPETGTEKEYMMSSITIKISKKQLDRVLEAYQTIQEFLGMSISQNELYRKEFLAGLRTAHKEIQSGKIKFIDSFDELHQLSGRSFVPIGLHVI